MERYGRPECLPGTRVDVLHFITNWVTDSSQQHNILWLNGVAGCGKSTLTTTIANLFHETNRLGAFLFFNRNVNERSQPASLIRTLAYQLGCFDPRLGDAISAAISHHPTIRDGHPLFQFSTLLREPLASQTDLLSEGPIVVVLDALDECGNAEDREVLLEVLTDEFVKLPPMLRVIIASRPEHDIQNRFKSVTNILPHKLSINSNNTQKDIERFIRYHLQKIGRKMIPPLASDWPGEHRISILAERASGLFVWASTACKFVDGYDPEQRLGIILQEDTSSSAESALDKLYTTALESVGEWTDTIFSHDFRAIVGTILVARDPLSASALNKLLPIDGHRHPLNAVSRLGCVLYSNAILRILHSSFADFLSNRLRCKCDAWFIDTTAHNLRVAIHCLDRMDGYLKHNVCNLKLFISAADVSLPEEISYACVFWVEHVCLIMDPSPIADRLETFLFKHLLHWFEAMTILLKSRETIRMLRSLRDWHRVRHFPSSRMISRRLISI